MVVISFSVVETAQQNSVTNKLDIRDEQEN